MNFSSSKSKKEKGQGLVEYALILTLVAVVVIAVLMALGPKISGIFSSINNSVSCTTTACPKNFGNSYNVSAVTQNGAVSLYCTNEGSGTGYNIFSNNGTYLANGSGSYAGWTFVSTGSCP
jgi:pilus assembly protein Flp/PilA